jgi:hypothetical protein
VPFPKFSELLHSRRTDASDGASIRQGARVA